MCSGHLLNTTNNTSQALNCEKKLLDTGLLDPYQLVTRDKVGRDFASENPPLLGTLKTI